MSHTSKTTVPSARRELLVVAVLLTLAALVYRVGHIPGAVNSATLIAAALSLWSVLKLVAMLHRVTKPSVRVNAEPVSTACTPQPRQNSSSPRPPLVAGGRPTGTR